MTADQFREMALSFQGTEEAAHFDRRAFKITGKRIYATLHEESQTANLKLSETDQSVFSAIDKKAIYPVANKWGLQGWTTFELRNIPNEIMLDALDTAHKEVFRSKSKRK